MSSKPEDRQEDQSPKVAEALEKGEKNRLYRLGYKNQDILELGAFRCRAILVEKLKKSAPRPGINNAAAATMHTNERVDARAASGPKPSGIVTQLDPYTGKLLEGNDPIDSRLTALEKQFPGERFRAVNPDLPTVAGAELMPVYDDTGHVLKVGDLVIHRIPEAVYDSEYRQPNLRRSLAMSGQLPKTRDERGDPGNTEEQDKLAPVRGMGLNLRQNAADMSL